MDVTHAIFIRHWIYDLDVIYFESSKSYDFMIGGRTIFLKATRPMGKSKNAKKSGAIHKVNNFCKFWVTCI